jgi:hypothetical protein
MEAALNQRQARETADRTGLLRTVEAAGAAIGALVGAAAAPEPGPRGRRTHRRKHGGHGHAPGAGPSLVSSLVRPFVLGVGLGVAFGLASRTKDGKPSEQAPSIAEDLAALLRAVVKLLTVGVSLVRGVAQSGLAAQTRSAENRPPLTPPERLP